MEKKESPLATTYSRAPESVASGVIGAGICVGAAGSGVATVAAGEAAGELAAGVAGA